MKQDVNILVGVLLVIISLYSIVFAIKLALEDNRQQNRIKTLGKNGLLKLEATMWKCLKSASIEPESVPSIERIINSQGYAIKEKLVIFGKEAYTTKKPEKIVYIRMFLPISKRRFVLAHELMHIIYLPDELDKHMAGRDRHSFWHSRTPEEQNRDYMAASLLLQRDSFGKEFDEADYAEMSPEERKTFVNRIAQKYQVEPSMVYRRIDEFCVLS